MSTDTSAIDRESPRPAQGSLRWFVAFIGILGLLVAFSGILGLLVAFFLPVRSPTFVAVAVGSTTLELEVARTPGEHRRGLSGRDELPGDGMLFFFDTAAPRVFWMKGMRLPIDIVWIRDDVVIGLMANAEPPPAGTPDAAFERFGSPGPVDRVIELAVGRASSLGIAPGQRVRILLPWSITERR